jgi:hypothetical protein
VKRLNALTMQGVPELFRTMDDQKVTWTTGRPLSLPPLPAGATR